MIIKNLSYSSVDLQWIIFKHISLQIRHKSWLYYSILNFPENVTKTTLKKPLYGVKSN